MDPLSIITSSFSLAGSIAKASIALIEFSNDFSDASKDIADISNELQALSAVLDPITRVLSRNRQSRLPSLFVQEVDNTIQGCYSVVKQVEETIRKYQRDRSWTKTKWVLFGQHDIHKLQESLEFYKGALIIGLHAISIQTGEEIKDETVVIRSNVDAIMLKTDTILARVNSIRQGRLRPERNDNIEKWIDDIAILSSYAESTYMETVIDPAEFVQRPRSHDKIALEGIDETGDETWYDPPEDTSRSTQQKSETNPLLLEKFESLAVQSASSASTATSRLVPAATKEPEKPQPSHDDPDLPGFLSRMMEELSDTPSEEVEPKKLCLDGLEDIAKDIEAIAAKARPDQNLIETSKAQRTLPGFSKDLDQMLHVVPSKKNRERFIYSFIARGANPRFSQGREIGSTALGQALITGDIGNVCALLQGGADPNTFVFEEGTILSHAAWIGHESAVWALVAAGADVNRWDPEGTIGRHFGSCLEAAFLPKRKNLANPNLENQVRIMRFLQANGAYLPTTKVHPCLYSPVSDNSYLGRAIRFWSDVDKDSATYMCGFLLEKGIIKVENFSFFYENPFCEAVRAGNEEILTLLGTYTDKLRDRPREAPADWWALALHEAVKKGSWGCVEILSKPPYSHPLSLLYLIRTYTPDYFPLPWPAFTRAVSILLKHGVNPTQQTNISYIKRRFLRANLSTEALMSPLELVEKVSLTKRVPMRALLLEPSRSRKPGK